MVHKRSMYSPDALCGVSAKDVKSMGDSISAKANAVTCSDCSVRPFLDHSEHTDTDDTRGTVLGALEAADAVAASSAYETFELVQSDANATRGGDTYTSQFFSECDHFWNDSGTACEKCGKVYGSTCALKNSHGEHDWNADDVCMVCGINRDDGAPPV